MSCFGLSQLITEPLRVTPIKASIIDHIFTNISRLEPIGLLRQKSLSKIGHFKVILHFYASPVDIIVLILIHIKATLRNA